MEQMSNLLYMLGNVVLLVEHSPLKEDTSDQRFLLVSATIFGSNVLMLLWVECARCRPL